MMFRMPTKGFARSVDRHNCALDTFADWVEGSVMLLGESVTRSDLVDRLFEGSLYREQDFAHEWLNVVFTEIRRRAALLGNDAPISVADSRIEAGRDWMEVAAYSFCMALALQVHYRLEIERCCGTDYQVQGELFERLTEESLRANDWSVASAGWSRNAAASVDDKIRLLAAAIGEQQYENAVGTWTAPLAKDVGLDLVAWQPFPDGFSGRPICLLQCASGENWEQKLSTPDLNTWCKLIEFVTEPRRGLAMPFAPESDVFRRRAGQDGVMLLLDRYRVLRAKRALLVPSHKLSVKLCEWTRRRIECFPVE